MHLQRFSIGTLFIYCLYDHIFFVERPPFSSAYSYFVHCAIDLEKLTLIFRVAIETEIPKREIQINIVVLSQKEVANMSLHGPVIVMHK